GREQLLQRLVVGHLAAHGGRALPLYRVVGEEDLHFGLARVFVQGGGRVLFGDVEVALRRMVRESQRRSTERQRGRSEKGKRACAQRPCQICHSSSPNGAHWRALRWNDAFTSDDR